MGIQFVRPIQKRRLYDKEIIMKYLHHNPNCTCEHSRNEDVPCTCGAEKTEEEKNN